MKALTWRLPFAQGPAWFDEAATDGTAHAYAECSARGLCDRETGVCACSDGFTGDACQVRREPITAELNMRERQGRPSKKQSKNSATLCPPHTNSMRCVNMLKAMMHSRTKQQPLGKLDAVPKNDTRCCLLPHPTCVYYCDRLPFPCSAPLPHLRPRFHTLSV